MEVFKAEIYYPSEDNNLTTLSPTTSFFSQALIKSNFSMSSHADDTDGPESIVQFCGREET